MEHEWRICLNWPPEWKSWLQLPNTEVWMEAPSWLLHSCSVWSFLYGIKQRKESSFHHLVRCVWASHCIRHKSYSSVQLLLYLWVFFYLLEVRHFNIAGWNLCLKTVSGFVKPRQQCSPDYLINRTMHSAILWCTSPSGITWNQAAQQRTQQRPFYKCLLKVTDAL